ncbi:DUF4376 domain-containing protein (plasmid) [Gemmobacter fulvus]|uniref:DUF4376 domain-containing protein n=1 Tax=Gemmobacter fulvus TaxID=2840474 RepID=A0A975PBD3_9RHOB|nr:DUF4376 domain-containing protein [Gemmobacter fulvus]MBT9247656.1 DUF4376 domain-containing protein [Gemmobacter fulvus]QWK93219.1 DUF4376 domain-containing protein [Gemmobacter fulvus]
MSAVDLSQLVLPAARAEQARAALRAAVTARRDRAIAAGLVQEGLAIATDDLSQSRILGAALSAVIDPDLVLGWKTADGRMVPLTAPQILALAKAVRAHVQACFDREAAILADLAVGGTPDLAAGWP